MRLAPLLVAFAVLVFALAPNRATAQNSSPAASAGGHRYFLDFRSRPTPFPTGHTYFVYWVQDSTGSVVEIHFGGLHPVGGPPVWSLGVLMPVPATERAPLEDKLHRPHAIFRVELSERQFAFLKRQVATLRRKYPLWHVLTINCNAFAAEVALSLGMRVPHHLLMPNLFVATLRALNQRRFRS